MKLFIQKLENGFTLTETHIMREPPAEEGGQPGLPVEIKRRSAFETVGALKAKLNELLPEPRNGA